MTTESYRTEPRRLTPDPRPLVDRVAAEWGDTLWLLGRVLIGGIFIESGIEKFYDLGAFAALLVAAGIPKAAATLMSPLGATVEVLGGLAIVLGMLTRYAAVLMIAFVIVATLVAHRFWELQGEDRTAQLINFAKNMGLIGGFLFVFVAGGGRYSLDRAMRRRR